MTEEHHDVIVTDRGGGGLGTGMILGIIVAVLVIGFLVWAFALGGLSPNRGGGGNQNNPSLPAASIVP